MTDEHEEIVDPKAVRVASGGLATRLDWSFKPRRIGVHRKLYKLARERDVRIRDLGGLTLEMVRQERLNPDMLAAQAGRILELERLVAEIETPPPDQPETAPQVDGGTEILCSCGWALEPGARFCSHCGRPTTLAPPEAAKNWRGWS